MKYRLFSSDKTWLPIDPIASVNSVGDMESALCDGINFDENVFSLVVGIDEFYNNSKKELESA